MGDIWLTRRPARSSRYHCETVESAQLYVSVDLAMRKAARDYLRGLAARLREQSGVQISPVILDGPTEAALVRYVRDIGADLVTMTTHGRSGVQRLILGGVADKLIRAGESPVLVVRPRN